MYREKKAVSDGNVKYEVVRLANKCVKKKLTNQTLFR